MILIRHALSITPIAPHSFHLMEANQKETKVLQMNKPPQYPAPIQQRFTSLSITIPEYTVPSTPNNTPTSISISLDDLESKLNQLKRERDMKH
jgi:hypothetical protein